MSDKINETIRNLEFVKDCFARQIKKMELLESEKRVKEITRTALASLYTISKRQNVPELKILADNIYNHISPKPENKWRKRLYFIFGIIFMATFSLVLGAPIELHDPNDKELSEDERELRESYLYTDSAIKILKKLQP